MLLPGPQTPKHQPSVGQPSPDPRTQNPEKTLSPKWFSRALQATRNHSRPSSPCRVSLRTWGETNSLTTTAFVDRLAVGGTRRDGLSTTQQCLWKKRVLEVDTRP